MVCLLRLRKNEAVLDKYRTLLREDVQFFTYLQFLFFRQWTALRDYVHPCRARQLPVC